MALACIGDIHGQMRTLSNIVTAVAERAVEANITACIQVGDLGLTKSDISFLTKHPLAMPVYFIDGNHEHFGLFYDSKVVTEIAPNLFYVPRGTVMQLDGRTVAFLGGASSIDKAMRLKNGWHWDERENIRLEERDRLYANLAALPNHKVDLLVTHIPPDRVIRKYFDPMSKLDFEVSIDWTDVNGLIVEEVWDKLGNPPMVCGHMHKDVQFDENAYILDIYQLRCM